MRVKLQKWGNGYGIKLPNDILQEAHIKIDDDLNIFVENGKIILVPLKRIRNKYDLKTLVAKMPKGFSTKALDWGDSTGKEE